MARFYIRFIATDGRHRRLHSVPVRHPFFSSDAVRRSRIAAAARSRPRTPWPRSTAAWPLGADGLELDVHLSRDGVVVVHHDRHLDRTTNLRGPIADRTAASWREPTPAMLSRGRGLSVSRTGRRHPDADDRAERYRDVPVIVELKVDTAEMARAVVGVARAADAVDRVCLGSFGRRRFARRARWSRRSRRAPRARRSAGRSIDRGADGRCRAPPTTAIRCPNGPAARASCRRASSRTPHRAGLGVQVWTVDTRKPTRRAARLGRRRVDYRSSGRHRRRSSRAPGRSDHVRPLIRSGRAMHCSPRAAVNTSSIIGGVSLPVFVFCRLGW